MHSGGGGAVRLPSLGFVLRRSTRTRADPLTGPKSKQRARLRWWVRRPAKEGQISLLGESVARVTGTRSNADGGDGHVSWAGLWPGLDAEFQGSALRASDPSCELPRKALPNPPGLRIHNEAAICG